MPLPRSRAVNVSRGSRRDVIILSGICVRGGGATGMIHTTKIRIARPTDALEAVTRFYREGLGLTELARFDDHEGFDGVMLGLPGAPYHLEFTHARGHRVGRAPTKDHLLVFYLPDESEWRAAVERLTALGHLPVPSFNPYWDKDGRTFEDPDGYRVVLQQGAWED